jgi:DNA-directed RNA polymerase alpha subunit
LPVEKGRFELGPFAPGGLTVANSLRRSLLSQLTGTAIPLVEISGAS